MVYRIWQGPDGERREIDGVLPLSEFGLEIHVAVAFLVLIVGRSWAQQSVHADMSDITRTDCVGVAS